MLALRASRQYVAALAESVQLRRFDPDQEVVRLMDESLVRVLIETLKSPDAMRVVHAFDLLPRLSGIDWKPHLAMLLDHAEAEVRVLVLEYLGEPGAAAYVEQVREKLRDPEERVRAAALKALCALEERGAVPVVVPFLQDSSPSIRAAAILGLVKYAGLDGLLHAGEPLKALLGGARTAGASGGHTGPGGIAGAELLPPADRVVQRRECGGAGRHPARGGMPPRRWPSALVRTSQCWKRCCRTSASP